MALGPTLQGKTVRMRPISEADAETTFKMRSDPEKSRYIHGATGTVDDQRDFIRKQIAAINEYLFAIEDLQGNLIGMRGLYDYDPAKNVIETGRFMSFGAQVQTLESMCLGFDFAFDTLSVDAVRMSGLSSNSNMRRIQEKFGAEVTEVRFSPEFECDIVYSILYKEMYAEKKPAMQKLIDRFSNR